MPGLLLPTKRIWSVVHKDVGWYSRLTLYSLAKCSSVVNVNLSDILCSPWCWYRVVHPSGIKKNYLGEAWPLPLPPLSFMTKYVRPRLFLTTPFSLVMLNPALRLSPSLTRYELKIVKSFLLLPSSSSVPTVEPFEEFLLTVSSFRIFPDRHVYMCTYNENNISKFILPCVVIRETVWRSTFTSNRIEIRPSITRCFFL